MADVAGSAALEACLGADRPGNRRADSFRKILTQPHVAAAVLVPGCLRVALVSGRARISTAAAVRAAVSVPGMMERGLRQDYKRNLY